MRKRRGETAPELGRLLASALDLTRSAIATAAAGDFEQTAALMNAREETLARAARLPRAGLLGTDAALLASLQEEDRRLMSTFQERRASIARGLEGVRLERAIAAYRS